MPPVYRFSAAFAAFAPSHAQIEAEAFDPADPPTVVGAPAVQTPGRRAGRLGRGYSSGAAAGRPRFDPLARPVLAEPAALALAPVPAPGPAQSPAAREGGGPNTLDAGNAWFRSNPTEPQPAIVAWLRVWHRRPSERRAVAVRLGAAIRGPLASADSALCHFHLACLAPGGIQARLALLKAFRLDPRLATTMAQVLQVASRTEQYATIFAQLNQAFGPLVGQPADDQLGLVEAMLNRDLAVAASLARRLRLAYPRLPVSQWATFFCAPTAEDGPVAPGLGLVAFQPEQKVTWARALVAAMREGGQADDPRAQGALSSVSYRYLWQIFLQDYAELAPQDFRAPEDLHLTATAGGHDPRYLHGLFWRDLLALPFPRPWPVQASLLAIGYASART